MYSITSRERTKSELPVRPAIFMSDFHFCWTLIIFCGKNVRQCQELDEDSFLQFILPEKVINSNIVGVCILKKYWYM